MTLLTLLPCLAVRKVIVPVRYLRVSVRIRVRRSLSIKRRQSEGREEHGGQGLHGWVMVGKVDSAAISMCY